jgi:serine phosphatase RsbU (regulator of sigma subunit)
MKPRNLRYLRVNDEQPNINDDLTIELPIDVDELRKWFEFCKDLARQKLWGYELLTLDFNFKSDTSGPWFPLFGHDPKDYNADFLNDPNLSRLRWPDSLVTNEIGPNSGLLIGAYLVSHSAYRDLPCGVAFHTRYPGFVIHDMPSAMLATQILLASGADLPTRDLRETMSKAIEIVTQSVHQPVLGLGTAAARFRQAFLRRAGAGDPFNEGEVRVWAEPSSLWALLNIFRAAQTEEELHTNIEKVGVEFYDRNGVLDSLNLRSMFLDHLIYRTQHGVTDVRRHLPLADVKPAGDGQTEPGAIWQFVETLAARTPSNIAPVLDFFRASAGDREIRSINEVVKRKIHRLLALVFAWLDLYAEGWFADQSQSFDPSKKEFRGSFPTLTEQIGALLKIYDLTREEGWEAEESDSFDPQIHFLPFTGRESISAAVRENASIPGSPLYKPLRYDRPDSDHIGQRRHVALENLLNIAVRWRCVEKEVNAGGKATGRYRLKLTDVPEARPYSGAPRQADIAQRLGFNVKPDQDSSTQLVRIIHDTPGFEKYGVKEFLAGLEERPLPDHLKGLGWEFMEEFWGLRSDLPLPYNAWPVCLSEIGRESGESISLVEWKRRVQRSQEAARQVQSLIMPSPISIREGRFEIWCWRHSAEEVGGDYYRAKKARDGEYRLYIGDACGSGPPAALLIQEIHGLITILEEQVSSPDQLCAQLDVRLYERTFGQSQQENAGRWGLSTQWASLFCALLDTRSNRLIYANAGHPPPILARRDGSTLKLEHAHDSRSLAVGQLYGSDYRSETVELTPGDRLVLFTDGISETLDERLLACVRDNRRLGAKELGEAIIQKTIQAKGAADDKSLIVVAVE